MASVEIDVVIEVRVWVRLCINIFVINFLT